MNTPVSRLLQVAVVGTIALAHASELSGQQTQTWNVHPDRGHTSIGAAVAGASPGDSIVVHPGIYTPDSAIVIDRPLTLIGEPGAILDGSVAGQIMVITADSVVVRGLEFHNVGRSFVEDRSAIRVDKARDCLVESNRFVDTFFGIYLANSEGCQIVGNTLTASEPRETYSGNGIHLWYSKGVTIRDNEIRGHRDGIYFEFVEDSQVSGNLSEGNLRYGLHFMFSNRCQYTRNRFHRNGAGVAVMYTDDMVMTENDFDHNWGTASFGLLLKEITDSEIRGNRFSTNSVGLYSEGGARLTVTGNEFRDNGWAVKLLANTEASRFNGNNFVGNSFDVATNSRNTESDFDGNFWGEYKGYDLDRDGVGDVPHRPVRLFSLMVERNEPTLVLMRSFLVQLLDIAESVIPALTPRTMSDTQPAMRPLTTPWSATP